MCKRFGMKSVSSLSVCEFGLIAVLVIVVVFAAGIYV